MDTRCLMWRQKQAGNVRRQEVKERSLTSVHGLPPSSAGYICSSLLLTSLHTYPRKEHVHPPIRPQKPQTQQKREPAAEVTEKSHKSGKKKGQKKSAVCAGWSKTRKISSSTQGLVLHKHTVLRIVCLEVSLIWSPISEKKIVKKNKKKTKEWFNRQMQDGDSRRSVLWCLQDSVVVYSSI